MQRLVIFILLVSLFSQSASAKSPFSLISFKRSKEVAQSSSLLTEDAGPWMIFVAAFAGEGSEAEARQLVNTLRTRFKLNAYLHKKQYDFTEKVQGKGFDMYGNPKKMRFMSANAFAEYAVLVGDYADLDDPKLEKHLKLIKYATAEELSLRGTKQNPTTRRFAGLRSVHKKLARDKTKKKRGPLRLAFVTRNPMLPSSAVAPVEGLSEELIEANEKVKYSLLKNPGKYTVRVASFRGQVVIDQKKIYEIEQNKRSLDGRIDETDDKAEAMVRILREKHGVEAYVFHDYHESIVTVGSFAEVGRKQADGKIDLNPKIAEVMETYGPSKKPIPGAAIRISGIQPKRLKEGPDYLFDIAPQPILVPRKSIAQDYARR